MDPKCFAAGVLRLKYYFKWLRAIGRPEGFDTFSIAGHNAPPCEGLFPMRFLPNDKASNRKTDVLYFPPNNCPSGWGHGKTDVGAYAEFFGVEVRKSSVEMEEGLDNALWTLREFAQGK